MVNNQLDNESRNLLPLFHGLLLSERETDLKQARLLAFFSYQLAARDLLYHWQAFVTPVVEC